MAWKVGRGWVGMAGTEKVGFLTLVERSRWLVTHEDMMGLFCRRMELKGLRKMAARHVWATENNFLLLNLNTWEQKVSTQWAAGGILWLIQVFAEDTEHKYEVKEKEKDYSPLCPGWGRIHRKPVPLPHASGP